MSALRPEPLPERWGLDHADSTIIEPVHDLPSDLPRLRTRRTWYAMWVDRIDEAIAAAEQREKERQ